MSSAETAPAPPVSPEHVSPEHILRSVFGFTGFRGQQEAVIRHAIAGGDSLVLMPTGGGKSLCYQIPALCRPGVGLVVSPLIALMDDQVAGLQRRGVRAAALHSDLDPSVASDIATSLARGTLDLLYVSPERLLTSDLLARLSRQTVSLIAIDEAHCVSAWGHEFRPEYRGLATLGERFPGVPRLALTGTADERTRTDMLNSLALPEARVFASSFYRPNLHLATAPREDERGQLRAFLAAHEDQAGILYCGSRAKTERMAERLSRDGRPALAFHAGLSALEKRAALLRFRAGEMLTICATIAFGMGIDRPDVRYVVHLDMPDSLEAYYQQVGRAGRDGAPADALLLYGGEDIARARHWLAQSSAPAAQQKLMARRLEAMIRFSETDDCRIRQLLAAFGETRPEPCGHCDNCLRPSSRFDGSVEAQKVLSAIYRTGQRFGARHIASVLLGETSETALRLGHDKLPTFGAGRDRDERFWRGVVRQLIAIGAVALGEGEYATLQLVPDIARPILRGETRVTLLERALPAPVAARARGIASAGRARGTQAAPVARASLDGADKSLFEALRQWRLGECKAQNIPAYTVLQDVSLQEIATVRPRTLEELGQVRGVGQSKIGRYGRAILEIVAGAAL